ncbi:MAG: hypothetical protein Q9168_004913 [Polycauliona sp. 1 TL-2023]
MSSPPPFPVPASELSTEQATAYARLDRRNRALVDLVEEHMFGGDTVQLARIGARIRPMGITLALVTTPGDVTAQPRLPWVPSTRVPGNDTEQNRTYGELNRRNRDLVDVLEDHLINRGTLQLAHINAYLRPLGITVLIGFPPAQHTDAQRRLPSAPLTRAQEDEMQELLDAQLGVGTSMLAADQDPDAVSNTIERRLSVSSTSSSSKDDPASPPRDSPPPPGSSPPIGEPFSSSSPSPPSSPSLQGSPSPPISQSPPRPAPAQSSPEPEWFTPDDSEAGSSSPGSPGYHPDGNGDSPDSGYFTPGSPSPVHGPIAESSSPSPTPSAVSSGSSSSPQPSPRVEDHDASPEPRPAPAGYSSPPPSSSARQGIPSPPSDTTESTESTDRLEWDEGTFLATHPAYASGGPDEAAESDKENEDQALSFPDVPTVGPSASPPDQGHTHQGSRSNAAEEVAPQVEEQDSGFDAGNDTFDSDGEYEENRNRRRRSRRPPPRKRARMDGGSSQMVNGNVVDDEEPASSSPYPRRGRTPRRFFPMEQ